MNSHKSKKKSKEIKIKVEKDTKELYPMSHYIDDRVELTKQIFSTLKSKTIRNLAPEFIKKSAIEEIEELCLNEILGISTKRLTSIINATKCPTDTESSSDSDVHNIEEHISLEEISSDSGDENVKRKSTKGKTQEKKGKKTNTTENVAKNNEDNKDNDEEMSVLELLELQARARAIRSQLALEPIAKIEVDSDGETKPNKSNPTNTTTQKNSSKNKNENALKRPDPPMNGNAQQPIQNRTKKIKLKRNFRKPQKQESDNEANNPQTEKTESKKSNDDTKDIAEKLSQKNEKIIEKPEVKQAIKEKEDKELKENRKSPSPDVITILPSPETFFISDSSDDEKNKTTKNVPVSNSSSVAPAKKSAFDRLGSPVKDLRRESEEQESNAKLDVEEGEILDHENNPNELEKERPSEEKVENDNSESLKEEVPKNMEDENGTEDKETLNESDVDKNIGEQNDDQQNDDIISLGHDDFDDEMREQLEERTEHETQSIKSNCDGETLKSHENQDETISKLKSQKSSDEDEDEEKDDETNEPMDYIELHDSSDEQLDTSVQATEDNNNSQSWNTRWLRSTKVTKILAQSRLSNRVREKIKKNRKIEQEKINDQIEEPEPIKEPEKKFESKYEDGSVQQYKEILEREQSNSSSDKTE